jgi:methionyl-tRNA formyltransferase
MGSYVVVSSKSWHDTMTQYLYDVIGGDWKRISRKEDFTKSNLEDLNPDWIFIPHWSDIIPSDIYNSYKCVVFHMTDLPFGRGGSPLQNLIERGYTETLMSAIAVETGLDTGDVYLKARLALNGTAEEIFKRSVGVIQEMIKEIVKTDPTPLRQEGEVVVFKRRKPDQSNFENLDTIQKLYDFIRMLDCEGYPHAYIETAHFKIEFSKATINSNSIDAHVRIAKK